MAVFRDESSETERFPSESRPKTLASAVRLCRISVCKARTTPRLLMTLGIQLCLAALFLGCFSFAYSFDTRNVQRRVARFTAYSRVHSADRQPDDGRNQNRVAVDETASRPDDERYWLSVPKRTNGPTQRSSRRERTVSFVRFLRTTRNTASRTPQKPLVSGVRTRRASRQRRGSRR